MSKELSGQDYKEFVESLKKRVAESRYKAARKVNKELIMLYHHIGSEILQKQQANGWGAKVVDKLS